LLLLLVFAYC
jgi:hypothetical protein